jgi:hypothetical protein
MIRVLAAILMMASFAYGQIGMKEKVNLESLQNLGNFQVRIYGKEIESYPAKSKCVYLEWMYGEKNDENNWVSFTIGYRSNTPIQVSTPRGIIDVPINRVRLYIAPFYSQVFTREDIEKAPKIIKNQLSDEDKPVSMESYRLTPGRVYYARVQIEGYHLPPDSPGGSPGQHFNSVLLISDMPFKKGKPQRPLTPGFRGFTY